MFPLPSYILPSVSDPVVDMWVKPLCEFNAKYCGSGYCFSIHAEYCIEIMKSLAKALLDSVKL